MTAMAGDAQAAWIAAAASLAIAVLGAAVAVYSAVKVERLRKEYSDQVRREDREIAAQQQLDRYRSPLWDAADDLHHRIGNIGREGSVHAYLADPRRGPVTLQATLYRFASFWGVVEALYRDVSQRKFDTDPGTAPVGELLTKIGKAFATDEPDTDLMMWREEQRAVGELMHARAAPGSLVRVIGFSTFSDRYDTDFARWFEAFSHGIEGIDSPKTLGASRLVKIQELLEELKTVLSPNGT
jgi:hypothetical protein